VVFPTIPARAGKFITVDAASKFVLPDPPSEVGPTKIRPPTFYLPRNASPGTERGELVGDPLVSSDSPARFGHIASASGHSSPQAQQWSLLFLDPYFPEVGEEH